MNMEALAFESTVDPSLLTLSGLFPVPQDHHSSLYDYESVTCSQNSTLDYHENLSDGNAKCEDWSWFPSEFEQEPLHQHFEFPPDQTLLHELSYIASQSTQSGDNGGVDHTYDPLAQGTDLSPGLLDSTPSNQNQSPRPSKLVIKKGHRRTSGRKFRRIVIPPRAKAFLEEELQNNPYPKASRIAHIADQLELPVNTIKNWFSNARNRRTPDHLTAPITACFADLEKHDSGSQHPVDKMQNTPPTSPTSSNASLERYLAASAEDEPVEPKAIEANIQAALDEQAIMKYGYDTNVIGVDSLSHSLGDLPFGSFSLLVPRSPNPIPLPSLEKPTGRYDPSNFPFIPDIPDSSTLLSNYHLPERFGTLTKYTYTCEAETKTTNGRYASSNTESNESTQSNESAISCCSIDSRGSRRGRRQWEHRPEASKKIHTPHGGVSTTKPAFYCTFPGCGRQFLTEYQWNRHEVSIHYPQKAWICCADVIPKNILKTKFFSELCLRNSNWMENLLEGSFLQCVNKPESDRIFFRKDQLQQHLRTCHLRSLDEAAAQLSSLDINEITIGLTLAWEKKVTYESSQAAGLYCPSCEVHFATWSERKLHLANHFKDGVFIWDHPSVAAKMKQTFMSSITRDDGWTAPHRYKCPVCQTEFRTFHEALRTHKKCRGWSCRLIDSSDSIFVSTSNPTSTSRVFKPLIRCSICTFGYRYFHKNIDKQFMKHYMEAHKLGQCDQASFTDFGLFCEHLRTHHRADPSIRWEPDDLRDFSYGIESSLTNNA